MQLREMFRAFLEAERINRHFGKHGQGKTATGSPDWEQAQRAGLNREAETISLFWKAYEASRRLNLEVKPKGRNWDEFTIVHRLAVPHERVTSKDASKYITQGIYRRRWREELYKTVNGEEQYQTGRHFDSLQENPISSRKMNSSIVRMDDGNMQFPIGARCNTPGAREGGMEMHPDARLPVRDAMKIRQIRNMSSMSPFTIEKQGPWTDTMRW
jgi:hypothetical protein